MLCWRSTSSGKSRYAMRRRASRARGTTGLLRVVSSEPGMSGMDDQANVGFVDAMPNALVATISAQFAGDEGFCVFFGFRRQAGMIGRGRDTLFAYRKLRSSLGLLAGGAVGDSAAGFSGRQRRQSGGRRESYFSPWSG